MSQKELDIFVEQEHTIFETVLHRAFGVEREDSRALHLRDRVLDHGGGQLWVDRVGERQGQIAL